MKLSYLVVLIVLSLNSFSQLRSFPKTIIDFKEKQADSTSINIDSMLVLGVGTSVTRIFLQNLTDKITKDLRHRNIVVQYFYLGKDVTEAKKEFNLINKKGYKAILLCLPQDTAFYGLEQFRTHTVYITPYGAVSRPARVTRMSYQQIFDFQLYKNDAEFTKFWYASLDVDCDLSQKYASGKVAKKLVESFSKNRYITD